MESPILRDSNPITAMPVSTTATCWESYKIWRLILPYKMPFSYSSQWNIWKWWWIRKGCLMMMKKEEAVIAEWVVMRRMELAAVGALAVGAQLMFLDLSASAPAGRLLLSSIYAPVLIRPRMAIIRSTRTLKVLLCHTLHNIFGESLFFQHGPNMYQQLLEPSVGWMGNHRGSVLDES